MAIPDFNSAMSPVLALLSTVERVGVADIVEATASHFGLTAEEREELLPSGQDFKFRNRVRWVLFHFKKAGVVENPSRGVYRITNRGRELLRNKPADLNERDLVGFAEYRNFLKPGTEVTDSSNSAVEQRTPPNELLETSYNELSNALSFELLDRVKSCSPQFFEQLVVDLIVRMGYGGSRKDAGRAVGRSHDGGIDGVIKEDRLGLDIIYLQAKRWEGTVGSKEVQSFAGSLDGVRAKRGIFITTSAFSKEAREFVSKIDKRIVLIDGNELVGLMIEHDQAVSTQAVYKVKRIDTDYFEED